MPRVCKALGKLEKWMVLGVCIGEGRESYNTLFCRRVRGMKAGKILQRNFCSLSLCYSMSIIVVIAHCAQTGKA